MQAKPSGLEGCLDPMGSAVPGREMSTTDHDPDLPFPRMAGTPLAPGSTPLGQPARRGRFRHRLAAIALLALALRLHGQGWDQWHQFHPDERRIAEAVATISFSPLQLDPRFYAYGSFPLYVTRVVVAVVQLGFPHLGTYDLALRVGRGLSALWGVATVVLLGVLGRRLFGERVALLAAALLALAVTHLQNSHFATNDIPLAFLVLATLTLLLRAVEQPAPRRWAAVGAVAGLAVATKVSALPLALPVGMGMVLAALRTGSFAAVWGAAAAGGGAAAAAFLLAEPYALLSWPRFSADVLEQSRMVRQAGLYPYTHQYTGAPRLLYEVRELVLWGMGPLAGVAGLAGLVQRLRRRTPAPEWLLLAWAVPFLLINASFEIKYPRYLLPLVPLLCLWGARWLDELGRQGRARRWLARAVVAGTALYALMFSAIYTREHTVRQASRWFYQHVPTGSRVVIQEWDEGFPFHLPGHTPEKYRVVQLPLYEHDSPAKVRRLAGELAAADVVVLQTRRLVGSITRAEATFPVTARFFRLLYAGDLGFKLERAFTSRPRLGGLELPSELADESFSVYDHPKVVIFRKVQPLSAAELEELILTAVPSLPLSRDDLLLADGPPGENAPLLPRWFFTSSLSATAAFATLLYLLGSLAWRVVGRPWGGAPGLWALAKVLGPLGFSIIAWLGVSLGWMRFTRADLVTLLAVLAGLVWVSCRRPPPVPRREYLLTEAVSWGAFFLFLLIRAGNPEVFWGEKPMDFAILNALDRTTSLPPPEPWFAGSPLHYTYFGHYLVASWSKTLGIAPALAFNLGIAAVAFFLAAAAMAAALTLTARLASGVVAAGLVLLAGNLAGPVEAISRRTINFDYFWATSRVFVPAINEYPFWSLVFADLHAHLLAAPLLLTLVAVLVRLTRPAPGRPTSAAVVSLLLAAAATGGAVMITNGWSLPTVAALTVGFAGLGWWQRGCPGGVWALGWLGGLPALTLGGGYLLFSPFWSAFVAPPRLLGWERGPFAPLTGYLLVTGVFLALLWPALASRPLRQGEGFVWVPWRAAGALLLLGGGGALVGELALRATGREGSLPVALPLAVAVSLAALGLALRRDTPPGVAGGALLVALAFAMTAACELVFIWDRMNTVFKYYFEGWLLLGVGCTAVLIHFSPATRGCGGQAWRGAVALVALASAFTAVTGVWGRLVQRHTSGPRWTLDGMAYLAVTNPDEGAAFAFFHRLVPGLPTVVEAHGPSYQQYGRVSMNTGLPTVVGWDYHLMQRSQKSGEIAARARAVEIIYTSPDRTWVEAMLAAQRAAFVFLGKAERERYGPRAGAAFAAWPDLLRPVFARGSVTIFAVRGQGVLPPTGARAQAAPAPPPPVPALPAAAPLEQLSQPRGVAVDERGAVYVCDFGNNRIVKVDFHLRTLLGWGREGGGSGELRQPCGVAVGPDGGVYVADTWNHRVQVFSPDGELRAGWSGEFFGPRGVAVAADGRVYVADTGNGRIVRFTPDGRLELAWGGRGQRPGEMINPVGVAVDRDGRVWVADNGNARLQVFDPEGTFLAEAPLPGLRDAAFSEPYVAALPGGGAAVTVPLMGEIRLFGPDLTVRGTIALPRRDPPVRPTGLALLPDGRTLVVADLESGLLAVPLPQP